jgi:hypothetical protein
VTFFDDVTDPTATGTGAFPGSNVGPSLAGVSSVLSSIPIEIGTKKGQPISEPGYAGYPLNEIPTQDMPDLVSLDKAMLHIFQTDPSDLSALQKQMWDGNWYSPTTYKQGYTAGNVQSGDDTNQAWNSVVMTSAKSGKSIQQVLQEAVDRTNKAGGIDAVTGKAAAAAKTPVAKVDLYHFGNAIARNLIGREMSRDQMDKFIAQYQSADASGSAGSPEAAAESFLQNEDPGEVGAQRMLGAFDKLMQMVGNVKPVNLGG